MLPPLVLGAAAGVRAADPAAPRPPHPALASPAALGRARVQVSRAAGGWLLFQVCVGLAGRAAARRRRGVSLRTCTRLRAAGHRPRRSPARQSARSVPDPARRPERLPAATKILSEVPDAAVSRWHSAAFADVPAGAAEGEGETYLEALTRITGRGVPRAAAEADSTKATLNFSLLAVMNSVEDARERQRHVRLALRHHLGLSRARHRAARSVTRAAVTKALNAAVKFEPQALVDEDGPQIIDFCAGVLAQPVQAGDSESPAPKHVWRRLQDEHPAVRSQFLHSLADAFQGELSPWSYEAAVASMAAWALIGARAEDVVRTVLELTAEPSQTQAADPASPERGRGGRQSRRGRPERRPRSTAAPAAATGAPRAAAATPSRRQDYRAGRLLPVLRAQKQTDEAMSAARLQALRHLQRLVTASRPPAFARAPDDADAAAGIAEALAVIKARQAAEMVQCFGSGLGFAAPFLLDLLLKDEELTAFSGPGALPWTAAAGLLSEARRDGVAPKGEFQAWWQRLSDAVLCQWRSMNGSELFRAMKQLPSDLQEQPEVFLEALWLNCRTSSECTGGGPLLSLPSERLTALIQAWAREGPVPAAMRELLLAVLGPRLALLDTTSLVLVSHMVGQADEDDQCVDKRLLAVWRRWTDGAIRQARTTNSWDGFRGEVREVLLQTARWDEQPRMTALSRDVCTAIMEQLRGSLGALPVFFVFDLVSLATVWDKGHLGELAAFFASEFRDRVLESFRGDAPRVPLALAVSMANGEIDLVPCPQGSLLWNGLVASIMVHLQRPQDARLFCKCRPTEAVWKAVLDLASEKTWLVLELQLLRS